MDRHAPPQALAARIYYHLRTSIVLGATDRPAEARTEALVALALLRIERPDTGDEIDDLPRAGNLDRAQRDDIANRTVALARQLQAHYTSDGQHDISRLYEDVATATASLDWL